MENLFFSKNQLAKCGENVIIGKTVRIRYPELVEIGDNVIIDDFTYISTNLRIDNFVHISSGCKFIGGRKSFVEMLSFSTTSPNVVCAAGSDDYVNGLVTPMVPEKFKGNPSYGKISFHKHVIVGSNSTVLSNVVLSEGTSIGANSLVNKTTNSWSVYAGIPCRKIKDRDKNSILSLEKKFLSSIA